MRQAQFQTQSPDFTSTIAINTEGERLLLQGRLDWHTLAQVKEALQHDRRKCAVSTLDLRNLDTLDSTGALFLCELREQGIVFSGVRPEHSALLDLVCGLELRALPQPKKLPRWRELAIQIGKGADEAWRDTLDIVTFLGRVSSVTRHALLHPRYLRLAAVSHQVMATGISALPIIGLMAVMISIVIGYQSVAQLRPYGGEDFMVNLVAVSMLREMGVLITAIMVAGRSGSAFTAEIGVMKARDEIDALNVMGMEPVELLVVPRLLGLIITLPLLTFFADMMGLLGGAAIAQALLHISPLQYLDRMHRAIDGSDLFVGLFKAPIFAIVIAVIGCMHGLRVRDSAESVGQETTRAVVKSIFLVIVLDALFSILFEKLDL